MSIDEIYQAAKARGLVRSLRHFSQDFSGRTPNYASDTGLAWCSAGALLNLYRPPGRTSAVGPKSAGVQTVARSGGAQRRHPGGAALNGLEGGRAAAAGANAGLRKLLDGLKANQAARIWPEIADSTTAQRKAMPYEIDCAGITVDGLGEVFAAELHGRKRWCRDNCTGVFDGEPIWDRLSGVTRGGGSAFPTGRTRGCSDRPSANGDSRPR